MREKYIRIDDVDYLLIEDVTKGDLLSAYITRDILVPFDIGLRILQKNGYRLISLQENARRS